MDKQISVKTPPVDAPVPRQAHTDEQLIDLWTHGRSRHTQRAYRADAKLLLWVTRKRLREITLADLQAFADHLDGRNLRPASRHRVLCATKSLLAFAHRLGYLPFDVGRPLRVPSARDRLGERILDEGEVHRMLALETNARNRVMLGLLYASGVRVSELVSLTWRDCQPRHDGGQIAVFGKGGKTRTILLPRRTWTSLLMIRGAAREEHPVFLSRRGGHLDPSQVLRIVKAAAKRAGIFKPVSPHWLRHGHASHALDRGAPLHLVQATLGHASVATTGRYLHARPTDSSSRYLPI